MLVHVYDSAQRDLQEAFNWVAKAAPRTASAWLTRFQAHIDELAIYSTIYPQADEARKSKLPLRQSLFGEKPNVFRVIFFIRQNEVHVIRVVRGQRRPLPRREIHRVIDEGPGSGSSGV